MNAVNPPPGRYAQQGRSPIAWVYLCPRCGGYAPTVIRDRGDWSRKCQGCGCFGPETHKFVAVLKTDDGCGCCTGRRRVTGDLPAAAGRYAWTLVPPPFDDASGTEHPWVSQIEAGKRGLSAAWLLAVAAVLGVQPGDLLPEVAATVTEPAGGTA